MGKLSDSAKAALLAIARGHEKETSPHEASIFQHARRLALKHEVEAQEDGEEWLAELARHCEEDDFVAIFAKASEAARERAARFWNDAREPPAP